MDPSTTTRLLNVVAFQTLLTSPLLAADALKQAGLKHRRHELNTSLVRLLGAPALATR